MERIARFGRSTGLAVVLLSAAACGGSDGTDDEAVPERAGEVAVDAEAGTVRVTDDDGTVSEFDSTAELPEDWPAEIAPPEAVDLSAVTRQTIDGVTSLVAFGDATGTVDEYLEALKLQFEVAGLTLVHESSASGSGSDIATIGGTGDAYEVTAIITGDGTSDEVTISWTLTTSE